MVEQRPGCKQNRIFKGVLFASGEIQLGEVKVAKFRNAGQLPPCLNLAEWPFPTCLLFSGHIAMPPVVQ